MRSILFLLIFGITGTGILIGLGIWQVQRLAWKQGILSEIEARIDDAAQALPDAPDVERDRYLPVEVSGVVGRTELHVLVSRKRIGAGYRIVVPFDTDGGRRVLLDRGFVRERDKQADRSSGLMRVTGNLHWPRETDRYTPPPDRDRNIWFARDVAAMGATLETEPLLIVAKSQTDLGVTPLPVDTTGIPNDHLQYAITWFSLAVIWAGMTAAFLWRSRAKSKSGST